MSDSVRVTTHHADGTSDTMRMPTDAPSREPGREVGIESGIESGIEAFAAVPRPFWQPDEDRFADRFAWLRDRRVQAAGLLGVAVILGLVWVVQSPAAPGARSADGASSSVSAGAASAGAPSASGRAGASPTPTSQPAQLTVHVAGAVARAGIVQLAPGARVVDALTAAGGPQPEADLTRLNLAAPVADGMQVLVAKVGEPLPAGSPAQGAAGGDGMVNINTATAAELDTLPGIGPTRAAAIIAEREANGPFASADDLERVKGLGATRIEELRSRVRT